MGDLVGGDPAVAVAVPGGDRSRALGEPRGRPAAGRGSGRGREDRAALVDGREHHPALRRSASCGDELVHLLREELAVAVAVHQVEGRGGEDAVSAGLLLSRYLLLSRRPAELGLVELAGRRAMPPRPPAWISSLDARRGRGSSPPSPSRGPATPAAGRLRGRSRDRSTSVGAGPSASRTSSSRSGGTSARKWASSSVSRRAVAVASARAKAVGVDGELVAAELGVACSRAGRSVLRRRRTSFDARLVGRQQDERRHVATGLRGRSGRRAADRRRGC